MTYELKQCKKLTHDFDYGITVQLHDSKGNKTNYMTLNEDVINALQNILFTKAIKEAAAREENLFKDGSINWDYVDADLSIDGWREKVGEEIFIATIDESATLQRKEST
tara:strand:+ start:88 stop:414 length:327 start_codon:yes stop_codon:yes gene_type:complete